MQLKLSVSYWSISESNSWLVCRFWFFVSLCLYVCISRSTAIVYSMISEMACAAISFALVRVPKHFPVPKFYDRKCIITVLQIS